MKQKLFKNKLWKEIAFIVTLKIIIITIIWYCFFKDPFEKHLTPQKFADHLLPISHSNARE